MASACLLSWMLFERRCSARHAQLLQVCENIAEGRLNNKLSLYGKGETGRLERVLAYMQVHLKVVIDELQMTAQELDADSDILQDTMHGIYQKMEIGNQSVEQMSAGIEQLSTAIEQVAQNAERTASLSAHSRDSIHASTEDMNLAHARSQQAVQSVEDAQRTIHSLSDAIASISKVTQTIHEIADQTNLLALNAAIEAARAKRKWPRLRRGGRRGTQVGRTDQS
ncbi:methyl-accepting chemotaxis protein [Paludibacterium denitrificans]|uniref:methyl-accepting chemotaxis protein n=1 Tax=Paludibacterium denitrificans TaxID=2675226 RepID=UPI002477D9EA|nr:methyl-accepting chemotaxis protein [Paludibacterium denitrificans]